MFYKIKKTTGIKGLAIFVAIFTALCVGCVPQKTVKQKGGDTQEAVTPKLITAISTAEDDASAMITIAGNQLLTYTSVKQPIPLGVLLYFPDTTPDNIDPRYTPDSSVIDSISVSELTDKGRTTRVEILLKKDVSYEVMREDANLKIAFEKAAVASSPAEPVEQKEEPAAATAAPEVKPAEQDMVAATRLASVEATQLEKGVSIAVKADGAIKEFKSFTTENPSRIVFDMYDIKSPFTKEQIVPVDSKWVKRVRHYGHPDHIRLVLDTYKSYLYAFSAVPRADGLLIHVGEGAEVAMNAEVAMKEKEAPAPAMDTSGVAWVNRIDFSSEDAGKSTIIIGTTKPVTYEITKTAGEGLQLKLFNTNLPDYRRRPLITTRFEAAVDRILPVQTAAMKDTTMIGIELREPVPYYVEQMDNLLLVHFEASSISPKPLAAADLPAWQKVAMEGVPEAGVSAAPVPEPAEAEPKAEVWEREVQEASPVKMMGASPETVYTGEKISIDFFDTDIKNVFRILKEISGKNFAIDKDVTGKVTLSLARPVPWDQILDLILRMNGLGKVAEGDIIRIATRQTLSAEEQFQRAQADSKKQTEQKQKELEPLVTEYIPVNYADAAADIKPHITTTERGNVTVDARNNQIIITDVAEKIEQAKKIISRIDKVTPQVIIEARIIEASNSFSRTLGTTWTSTIGPITDSTIGRVGGDTTFTLGATNPPDAANGSLGISFSRLLGTPLAFDVTIQAAESRGEIEIISAPKVVTLDNKEATIKQGLAYPYNKLDADGNTTTEFKDIALELLVTPHVTPDNRISMKIDVKNNEVGAVINNELSFTTKEATTELLVNDGDTVVIGGIRKTTRRDDDTGVPGLMDIPIIGWFFKARSYEDNKEELLIFITPRIVQLEQRTL